ncbi:MetQ/NlpA family ABC transporter substrate-binding protein [Kytococcus schroeteri]|uniref:MetQ/NlpA family ABC transporter substrate-binding protein n=1 Tax=Kytococcus schroeteri TaxID=138300 RepID=UPI0035ED60F4
MHTTSHTTPARRRTALGLAALALAAPALTGCGAEETRAEEDGRPVLRVAATPTPHADILRHVDEEQLDAEAGFELEVVEFTDYLQPNAALDEGSVDANYYQHRLFLQSQEQAAGYDFEVVAPISNQPLGLYSEEVDSLEDLAPGSRVAIPNDPTNGARGLWLLQEAGLIELADTGDLPPTPEDVTSNPRDLEFLPVEAAQTSRSVGDATLSAVPGNYAVQDGLDTDDALALEDPRDERFVINLVTTADRADDPQLAALADVLHGDAVGEYIESTWHGTVVQVD